MLKRPGALLVALTMAISGCATQYQPLVGPRISTVVHGGQLVYTRDGKEFPHGFAGGGLVDAVEGDPEATEAAETYHGRNIGGFVATMVGTACLIGGIVVLASASRDNGYGSTNHTADYVGGGALLCTMAGLITGTVLIASGQTYQFDAVNIYNDHVDQRMRVPYFVPPGAYPPPPGPVPPAIAPPPPAPSGTAPPLPAPPPQPDGA